MRKGLYGLLAGALLLGSTGCSDYVKRDEVAKDYVKKEEVAANYVKKDSLEEQISAAFKRRFPDATDGKYDFNGSFVDWNKFDIGELVKAKQTVEVELLYKLKGDSGPFTFIITPNGPMGIDYKSALDNIINSVKSNKALRQLLEDVEFFKKGEDYFVKRRIKGTAIGIFEDYLLTLDHIVNVKEAILKIPLVDKKGSPLIDEEGIMAVGLSVEEQSRRYNLVVGKERKSLRKIVSGKVDAALLKLSNYKLKESLSDLPYVFGDSDKLNIGNWVMIVGKPLQMDDNTRTGTVTNTYPLEGSKPKPFSRAEGFKLDAKDTFLISTPVIPGDSGSLVLASKDGNLEIVGFVDAVFPAANMNFAIRSNNYLDVILPAIIKDNPDLAKTKEFQNFFGNYLNSKTRK